MGNLYPERTSPGRMLLSHFCRTAAQLQRNRINLYVAGGKFDQHKMVQKSLTMTETLAYGYSYTGYQRDLSREYQRDEVK